MERTILINQQVIKLTVVQQLEICTKCHKNTELRLIGASSNQIKKYCHSCSQEFLTRLENYQFINKEQIIKKIKDLLTNSPQLWSDYYVCKKPACLTCLNLGIKETEFSFCGPDCLVRSFIQYHGHNHLKNKQI